jgi:hypothetical protein
MRVRMDSFHRPEHTNVEELQCEHHGLRDVDTLPHI